MENSLYYDWYQYSPLLSGFDKSSGYPLSNTDRCYDVFFQSRMSLDGSIGRFPSFIDDRIRDDYDFLCMGI